MALLTYGGIASPWIAERAYVFRDTLDDMRRQYPKYADLSHVALKDAVYKDFYSDMTRLEFEAALEEVALELARRERDVPDAALRAKLISEKRIDALWSAVGTAFIPPLSVLVLGFAIAWALAGFRRPPSPG